MQYDLNLKTNFEYFLLLIPYSSRLVYILKSNKEKKSEIPI